MRYKNRKKLFYLCVGVGTLGFILLDVSAHMPLEIMALMLVLLYVVLESLWDVVAIGYRDVRLCFYGVMALVVVALVHILERGWISFPVFLVCLYVFVFCYGTGGNFVIRKRDNQLYSIMMDRCRLQEFIDQYGKIYNKISKESRRILTTFCLANAYMHMGNLQQARALYQQIQPEDISYQQIRRKKARQDKMVEYITYHNNMTALSVHSHDLSQAREHLYKAEEALEQLKNIQGKNKAIIQSAAILSDKLSLRKVEIALEQGCVTEGMVEQMEHSVATVQQTFDKVYYQYLLCKMYSLQGNVKSIEEGKRFIQTYGGDSCYVRDVNYLG